MPGEAAETDEAHLARHRNTEAAKSCARCYFLTHRAEFARCAPLLRCATPQRGRPGTWLAQRPATLGGAWAARALALLCRGGFAGIVMSARGRRGPGTNTGREARNTKSGRCCSLSSNTRAPTITKGAWRAWKIPHTTTCRRLTQPRPDIRRTSPCSAEASHSPLTGWTLGPKALRRCLSASKRN